MWVVTMDHSGLSIQKGHDYMVTHKKKYLIVAWNLWPIRIQYS